MYPNKVLGCCFLFTLAWLAQAKDKDTDVKLDADQASVVSSLLKDSAERAAANAPIILNRNSHLFKRYWLQRLPRRAPQIGLSFFREDTRKTTPKPHISDGSTEYKPSTVLPPLQYNDVDTPKPDPVVSSVVESQDEPGPSLQQQLQDLDEGVEDLVVYSAPEQHHVKQLPPLKSDLYSGPEQPAVQSGLLYSGPQKPVVQSGLNTGPVVSSLYSAQYPNNSPVQSALYTAPLLAESDPGTYNGPPQGHPSLAGTFVRPQQPKKILRPLGYSYTEEPPVTQEVQYKGYTEQPAVTAKYTKAPVREYNEQYDSVFGYQVLPTPPSPPTTPPTTTTTTPVPTTTKKYYMNLVTEQPYTPTTTEQIFLSNQPSLTVVEYKPVYVEEPDTTTTPQPYTKRPFEPLFQYETPTKVLPYQPYPPPPAQYYQQQQHRPLVYKQPEPPKETVRYPRPRPPSNKNPRGQVQNPQQAFDTTPHPLVFGFKPVASFVSSAIEAFRGSNSYNRRPPPPPPPPPKPHNNRKPKFFYRTTYQSKPIRFPGF